MMRRAFLMVMIGVAQVAGAQDVDTVLARVERLAVGGDRSSARALTDSLIAALGPESPRLADALYWRAQTSPSAADAERDYLRIAIEHPFSSRAPDALLALAQLEFARGDRNAARRRFERVLRDYPRGKHVPRASLWSGRLALEERDYAGGCATLNAARPLVAVEDIELRNQFDYFIAQCDRAPVQSPDTAGTTPPQQTVDGPEFSVQVAAYRARSDAVALERRLKGRGYDVRIVGDASPYRVRIGRYATRADAVSALSRMRTMGLNGIVVEAERR